MRIYLDCIPCFIRQALDSARLVTDDKDIHEKVLRQVLLDAGRMDLSQTPPQMAQRIYRLIRKLTGIEDPYAEIKKSSNIFAQKLYPEMKNIVETSKKPFETAVRLAIAGNIIDFGVRSDLEESHVHDSIEDALDSPIDANTISDFQSEIDSAEKILYIADNAGEIVFDRLLIEQMPMEKITLAVKGRPIINDATMEDAVTTGITGLVKVIDNGSDAPGTILEECSDEFRKAFDTVDLVVAKGQGNYETLSGIPKNIFFLLKVKCPVIAGHIGTDIGSIVISRNSGLVID